jgi:hypothetical protein
MQSGNHRPGLNFTEASSLNDECRYGSLRIASGSTSPSVIGCDMKVELSNIPGKFIEARVLIDSRG